ncbi:hypothetical protein [Methylobacterium oxalidis]|uniref:Uncharacterized protein n=1 Tax=Methylobacterium oxalidis TaxID=944322 RepID=A0A512IX31_9HYPH|nr:hypothetical protein [Methylobacterium oxalidis]GEP02271.1 hypothetical protein MOX02_03090 [Methylobacterium oxalidis]GJE32262.1 hypothetical protein LDDCCGHA_2448 [Methylobacterium oxalidis]GLS62216.1 hypothetical protein GCM10007888_05970 [Methylobacterium oxalidis]
MTLPAFQGRTLARLVDDVQTLLAQGEAPSSPLRALEVVRATGLWCEHGELAVASPAIVALVDRLPRPAEALTAVFSLVPEVREAWLRIVRARLAEMGERRDVAALTEAVTNAGALAVELVRVKTPSLIPTAFGELERAILPAPAHEAAAFPVLLRALAATTALQPDTTAAMLPDIAFDDPSTAWREGRLLRLPTSTDASTPTAVLSGALDGHIDDVDAMRWALHHPWAFLLAQMTFTKEAWEAERVSGGIAFELEPAHASLFQSPPCVEVVVSLPSGEEVRCGSLGELTQRILAQLGVTVLGHRVTASALDDRLALVIDAVQQHDVWRFEHGSGARRPAYTVHPAFSDACYRALGSRAFYRLGSPVTAAIRRTAEGWARERIVRAGTVVGEGVGA